MKIVTGRKGTPHVSSNDDQARNQAILGTGEYVFNIGAKFEATVVSANEIWIGDGEAVMQGVHFRIEPNTYDTVTIENGSQGMKRIDLIVARYEKDAETDTEDVTLQVIKGEAVASNPQVPSYNTGDILQGDLLADMPLYEVLIDGIAIDSTTSRFSVSSGLVPRVNNAEAKLAKYDWFSITSSVVTENNLTNRTKALNYLDDVIIGNGSRFRGIYFVGAFATLIGLPSDSYYAVIMSNSVNGRSLLVWNLNASRMYVITKRNGTWDTDLVRVPTLSTPLFKRVSYTISNVTLAAGATKTFTAAEVGVSAPSGYVAIGADQIQTNSQCSIGTYSLRATGTNPFLAIKNNSTGSTTIDTMYIRVTYARSDMFE